MSRRVSLPGASELFRPTQGVPPEGAPGADPARQDRAQMTEAEPAVRGSGRVRHDEKITVYVSGDELLALEQARLTMRARHGLAVDRGRIVREAISAALADLDAHGDDSELVRRLSTS